MATLLPGHRDPGNPAHRAEVAALWGVDALPERPGKTAVELFQAAARGEVKALWIACTNPAQSMPDQALVRAALERCELVILQEAFAGTATAAFADVVLPATTWAEKEGTVTNSERRISRVRAALPPAGDSRADWRIVRDVARRVEAVLRPTAPSLFAWNREEQLWLEHREATLGRDLDIGGLSYPMLEEAPRQWPWPAGAGEAKARLYEDGEFAHADGRARFITKPFAATAEVQDAKFPLALSTGRLRDQWHGMSRSGTVAKLFAGEPGPAVTMHPQDMDRRGLKAGALVRVRSRRGELIVPLRADDGAGAQQAWLPMHWGSEFLGGRGLSGINALTQPAYCPDSRQPELKFTAVAVEAVDLPWRVFGAAWIRPGEGAALRSQLRALMAEADYACCLPGPAQEAMEGWSLELAFAEPPPAPVVQALAAVLQLNGVGVLRYADGRRGRSRSLRLDGEGADARLQALMRVGEGSEAEWLDALWRERAPVAPYGRRLLAPDAEQPAAAVSPQICNCFNVREDAIAAYLRRQPDGTSEARLAALQGELRCGTQCGSCLPALRRLVQTVGSKTAVSSPSPPIPAMPVSNQVKEPT